MTSIIELDIQFDIDKLITSVDSIRKKYPPDPKLGAQICLQHSHNYSAKHLDGCGGVWYNDMDVPAEGCVVEKQVESDAVFDTWIDDLQDEYAIKCLQSLPIPVVRTRIMPMRPSSCYRMHSDRTIRLHIPLHHADKGRFIFDHGEVIKMKSGHVYIVNTTLEHTAMNTSTSDYRIHLVTCLPEPHKTTNKELLSIYDKFGIV